MFGPPGFAYVYFTYGMHHCMNVVTEPEGSGTGVLLRAIEPLEGVAVMRRRRGPVSPNRLTDGPGKLCQALAIGLPQNRADLQGGTLWVEAGEPVPASARGRSARIGIRNGREQQARFFIRDNAFVSRHPGYPSN